MDLPRPYASPTLSCSHNSSNVFAFFFLRFFCTAAAWFFRLFGVFFGSSTVRELGCISGHEVRPSQRFFTGPLVNLGAVSCGVSSGLVVFFGIVTDWLGDNVIKEHNPHW